MSYPYIRKPSSSFVDPEHLHQRNIHLLRTESCTQPQRQLSSRTISNTPPSRQWRCNSKSAWLSLFWQLAPLLILSYTSEEAVLSKTATILHALIQVARRFHQRPIALQWLIKTISTAVSYAPKLLMLWSRNAEASASSDMIHDPNWHNGVSCRIALPRTNNTRCYVQNWMWSKEVAGDIVRLILARILSSKSPPRFHRSSELHWLLWSISVYIHTKKCCA